MTFFRNSRTGKAQSIPVNHRRK